MRTLFVLISNKDAVPFSQEPLHRKTLRLQENVQLFNLLGRCYDIHPNNTQQNESHHNKTKQNDNQQNDIYQNGATKGNETFFEDYVLSFVPIQRS